MAVGAQLSTWSISNIQSIKNKFKYNSSAINLNNASFIRYAQPFRDYIIAQYKAYLLLQ